MNENFIINVISNIQLEPYFTKLVKEKFYDQCIRINLINYNQYDSLEFCDLIKTSNLLIVLINIESLCLDILNSVSNKINAESEIIDKIKSLCKNLIKAISAMSNVNVYWFLFEDYDTKEYNIIGNLYNSLIDKLNIEINSMVGENIRFIDLKRMIASIGINNAYSLKNKYRWDSPYSKELIHEITNEIYKQYLIDNGVNKKCLILDCDNVLWGGILSEDGINGITLAKTGLGRSYQDFQRFVLNMHNHGVILAICSKNDLLDILDLFKNHTDMILKEENIACFQVNWDSKVENIKNISKSLNIGFEDIVFIDDSHMEVESIKAFLPQVTSILYDKDNVYKKLSLFNLKNNIDIIEFKKRNETYRTNKSRELVNSQYANYSEYIAALNIKIDIHETILIEANRVSELTQRTNKCTNGKRYKNTEIKERIMRGDGKIYSVSVSDSFSDLGLVGVIEITSNILALFSLSCRALDRNVEEVMLDFISSNHIINEIDFVYTNKNEGVKTLLANRFPNAIMK